MLPVCSRSIRELTGTTWGIAKKRILLKEHVNAVLVQLEMRYGGDLHRSGALARG